MALSSALVGCESSRETLPVQPVVCPPRIQQLANALAIYRARYASWPDPLDQLIERDLLRGAASGELLRYGYEAAPLAVLHDGRWVMLVDDVVNPDDSVWCIVQTPAVAPRQPVIDVVALPWETLEVLAAKN